MTLEQWQEISDRNAKAQRYLVNTCKRLSKEFDSIPFWRIFKLKRAGRKFGFHNKLATIAGEETLKHIDNWKKDIAKRKKENEEELAKLKPST